MSTNLNQYRVTIRKMPSSFNFIGKISTRTLEILPKDESKQTRGYVEHSFQGGKLVGSWPYSFDRNEFISALSTRMSNLLRMSYNPDEKTSQFILITPVGKQEDHLNKKRSATQDGSYSIKGKIVSENINLENDKDDIVKKIKDVALQARKTKSTDCELKNNSNSNSNSSSNNNRGNPSHHHNSSLKMTIHQLFQSKIKLHFEKIVANGKLCQRLWPFSQTSFLKKDYGMKVVNVGYESDGEDNGSSDRKAKFSNSDKAYVGFYKTCMDLKRSGFVQKEPIEIMSPEDSLARLESDSNEGGESDCSRSVGDYNRKFGELNLNDDDNISMNTPTKSCSPMKKKKEMEEILEETLYVDNDDDDNLKKEIVEFSHTSPRKGNKKTYNSYSVSLVSSDCKSSSENLKYPTHMDEESKNQFENLVFSTKYHSPEWNEENDPTGYVLREKIYGMNCCWDGNEFFLTKPGKQYPGNPTFIKNFPDIKVIGVLKSNPSSQDKLHPKIRDNSFDTWRKYVFIAYDIPEPHLSFRERMQKLNYLCKDVISPFFRIAEAVQCQGQAHFDRCMEHIQNQEIDGLYVNHMEGRGMFGADSKFFLAKNSELFDAKLTFSYGCSNFSAVRLEEGNARKYTLYDVKAEDIPNLREGSIIVCKITGQKKAANFVKIKRTSALQSLI